MDYETTRKHLETHFGTDKHLSDISAGDADDWRESLLRKGLSAASNAHEITSAFLSPLTLPSPRRGEGTKVKLFRERCYRHKNANLRTQLIRMIENGGLQPWPKPFHNMRASRETELMDDYPIHVVCAWIGNTAGIAAKHYLQVQDSDFERAAKSAAPAQQQAAASDCTESQETKKARQKRAECVPVQQAAMPCNEAKHPLGETNTLRKRREKAVLRTASAPKAAPSSQKRPQLTPIWRPWLKPGPSCRKPFGPASWR